MPPLAPAVWRTRIVATPHANGRAVARKSDGLPAQKRQERVHTIGERAANGHKFGTPFEKHLKPRYTLHHERQRMPRPILAVQDHLLRAGRKRRPNESCRVGRIVAPPRHIRLRQFTLGDARHEIGTRYVSCPHACTQGDTQSDGMFHRRLSIILQFSETIYAKSPCITAISGTMQ